MLKWPYLPFAVLGIIAFLIHLPMQPGASDDLSFAKMFSTPGFDPFSYSVTRYLTWTSRTLLEFLLMFGISIPEMFWKLADTLVFVTIGVFISKLTAKERRLEINAFIASLMLLYPYTDLSSAGWITTTVNYSWPLMFSLIALYPLRKTADGRRIKAYEYPLYSVSLLIAANQEQLCFVLLAVYGTFTAYMLIKRKPRTFVLVQLGLCILSLAYILLCPGNAARSAQETSRWFTDYRMFSFLQKLESGISGCLASLFLTRNAVFLVSTFIVFLSVRQKYKCVLYRLIAALPFFSAAVLFVLYFFKNGSLALDFFFNVSGPYGIINSQTIDFFPAISAMFGMLLMLCFLLISVYMAFGDSFGAFKAASVIAAGTATKTVIGFSPTIWVSLSRTGIFLMFSLIYVSVYLLNDFESPEKHYKRAVLIFAVLLGVIGSGSNIAAILAG
jgi:hypothetical protein